MAWFRGHARCPHGNGNSHSLGCGQWGGYFQSFDLTQSPRDNPDTITVIVPVLQRGELRHRVKCCLWAPVPHVTCILTQHSQAGLRGMGPRGMRGSVPKCGSKSWACNSAAEPRSSRCFLPLCVQLQERGNVPIPWCPPDVLRGPLPAAWQWLPRAYVGPCSRDQPCPKCPV